MPDIPTLTSDPDFLALPEPRKRVILRDYMKQEPDFGTLPASRQGALLNDLYKTYAPVPVEHPKVPAETGNVAADWALGQQGNSKYVWGGNKPDATDCSGLTCQAFKKQGINLPRTAREQFMAGQPVDMNGLQPGDQVFFEGTQKALPKGVASHTGIYIGNGQFVHQSSSGGTKVSPLSEYAPKFLGAKRHAPPAPVQNLATLNQDMMNQAFAPAKPTGKPAPKPNTPAGNRAEANRHMDEALKEWRKGNKEYTILGSSVLGTLGQAVGDVMSWPGQAVGATLGANDKAQLPGLEGADRALMDLAAAVDENNAYDKVFRAELAKRPFNERMDIIRALGLRGALSPQATEIRKGIAKKISPAMEAANAASDVLGPMAADPSMVLGGAGPKLTGQILSKAPAAVRNAAKLASVGTQLGMAGAGVKGGIEAIEDPNASVPEKVGRVLASGLMTAPAVAGGKHVADEVKSGYQATRKVMKNSKATPDVGTAPVASIPTVDAEPTARGSRGPTPPAKTPEPVNQMPAFMRGSKYKSKTGEVVEIVKSTPEQVIVKTPDGKQVPVPIADAQAAVQSGEFSSVEHAKGVRAAKDLGAQVPQKLVNEADRVLAKSGEAPMEKKVQSITKDGLSKAYVDRKPVAGDTWINAKGDKVEIGKFKQTPTGSWEVDYHLTTPKGGRSSSFYVDNPKWATGESASKKENVKPAAKQRSLNQEVEGATVATARPRATGKEVPMSKDVTPSPEKLAQDFAEQRRLAQEQGTPEMYYGAWQEAHGKKYSPAPMPTSGKGGRGIDVDRSLAIRASKAKKISAENDSAYVRWFDDQYDKGAPVDKFAAQEYLGILAGLEGRDKAIARAREIGFILGEDGKLKAPDGQYRFSKSTPPKPATKPELVGEKGKAKEPWEVNSHEHMRTKFQDAADTVDGLKVRSHIPNMSSIDGYFSDFDTVKAVQKVALKDIDPAYYRDETAKTLAEQIRSSGEINPIIVGIDPIDGSMHVIEGQHRVAAMKLLGKKEIPAKVVIGYEDGGDYHFNATAKAIKEGKSVPQNVINEYPDLAKSVTPKETTPPEAGAKGKGEIDKYTQAHSEAIKAVEDAKSELKSAKADLASHAKKKPEDFKMDLNELELVPLENGQFQWHQEGKVISPKFYTETSANQFLKEYNTSESISHRQYQAKFAAEDRIEAAKIALAKAEQAVKDVAKSAAMSGYKDITAITDRQILDRASKLGMNGPQVLDLIKLAVKRGVKQVKEVGETVQFYRDATPEQRAEIQRIAEEIRAGRPVSRPVAKPATQSQETLDIAKSMQQHFGLPEKQAQAVATLVDARAKSWAKATGRPESEWYKGKMIVKGGTPGSESLFQENGKTLVALHNTNAGGIVASEKLGGIPAPAIAIIKAKNEFNSFGDITLVGKRDMIDPQADSRNKVYSSDVYSPRQPRESHDVVYSGMRKFQDAINQHLKADVPPGSLFDPGEYHISTEGGKERFIEDASRNPYVRAAYLKSKGEKVDIPTKVDEYGRSRPERYLLDAAMRERIKDLPEGTIEAWVAPQVEGMFKGPYLQKGRGKVPYTIDNLVDVMTKAGIRGGEKSMFSSLGANRAKGAKEFGSVEAMHKAEGNILSEQDFRKFKDALDEEFGQFQNEIMAAHETYEEGSVRGAFDRLDDSANVMGAYLKGPKTEAGMRSALRRNGFTGEIDAEIVRMGQDIAKKLMSAPTEYFEAKPKRAVKMNEMAGAVVPKGTSPEVIESLKRQGITDIRIYDRSVAGDRLAKVQALTAENEGALFQDKKAAVEFARDGKVIIRALNNPDVSSAMHEFAHVFRRDLAEQALVHAPSKADLAIAEAWAGVKDGKWETVHEEKFARGFERYLRDGKAPNEGLKRVFENFKTWLTEIYKTLKGSPINVKLSPEMRGVFDRLLTEEEPLNANQQRSTAPARGNESVKAPEGKAEAKGKGQEEVVDRGKQRMKYIEDAMAEAGLNLESRENYRTTRQAITDRAMKDYPDTLRVLRSTDPQKGVTLTQDEQVVGFARLKEISNELKSAEGYEKDALIAELTHLSPLMYRHRSEAGRTLGMGNAVIPDATDASSVMHMADKILDGNASDSLRKQLLDMSEKANKIKEQVTQKVQKRVSTRTSTQGAPAAIEFGAQNTRFTREKMEAARKSFLEKSGRASSGVDPAIVKDLVEIGGFYVEGGIRTFAGWAQRMKADLGDIDDRTLRTAWAQINKERATFKEPREIKPGEVEGRAAQRLAGLGEPKTAPKRPTSADVDEAMLAYADGAKDLNTVAQGLRRKYGANLDPIFVRETFRRAAEQYANDFHALDKITADMAEAIFKESYRNKGLAGKMWYRTREGLDAARAIMTSFDLSAPGRQGLLLSLSHPAIATKAFGTQLKAFANEGVAQAKLAEVKARVKSNPTLEKMDLFISGHDGNPFLQQEEAFRSRLAQKIPVVGRIVKASERAYSTFLNELRVDAAEAMTRGMENITDREAQAIGKFINASTGRGNVGAAAKSFDALSTVFFAPRLKASRFEIASGVPIARGAMASKRAGVKIAGEYLKTATALSAAYMLMKLAGGEAEKDPRATDFARMKFGNMVVDPTAGVGPAVSTATRVLKGEKKQQNGKIADLDQPETPFSPTRFGEVGKFFRGALAPAPGAAYTILGPKEKMSYAEKPSGMKAKTMYQMKDITGQPTSVREQLTKLFIPMSFTDVYEAAKNEGISPKAALSLLNFLGVSVQSRTPVKNAGKLSPEAQKRLTEALRSH